MPLKKQSGNMYSFVTHTWNPIKGKCSHDCRYCYVKKWGEQKEMHLDEKELKTGLGQDNFIFVGSGTDIWADDVPQEWIIRVLDKCSANSDNRFLFQSKNPERFREQALYERIRYLDTVVGTTIETDNALLIKQICRAPLPLLRAWELCESRANGLKTMVTIEPILDFDLEQMVELVKLCQPEWVNIGADSKGHNLPEPSGAKVRELIGALKDVGIDVKQKSNLKRILES